MTKHLDEGAHHGVKLYSIWLENVYDFAHMKCMSEQFKYRILFTGVPGRAGYANPCVQPLSNRYGNIEYIMQRMKPDLGIIIVSPPDSERYVDYGSNSIIPAAAPCCEKLVAQVSSQVKRMHGEGFRVHVSQFDAFVEQDFPLAAYPPPVLSAEDIAFGKIIAERIPDGACIQLDIGNIPCAIGEALMDHIHLDIYSKVLYR